MAKKLDGTYRKVETEFYKVDAYDKNGNKLV